jgi:hypothetical protein
VRPQSLPYDEAASATELTADCRAVAAVLRLPAPRTRYEDLPRDPEPALRIDAAAARLAAAFSPDRR